MLRNIYKKEMKDSFRDRRTLFLTVLLPIVMMTGLVLFYESMASDGSDATFKLAINDTISSSEEALFAGNENIELVKSADPEATLSVGDAQAAIILSTNFMETVQQGEEAKVTLIGDSFSQKSSQLMSLVTNALENYKLSIVSERLKGEGISENLVNPFEIEQQELTEENDGVQLIALLIPMILALAIGIGAGPSASDLFAGEKEKKTMEALLMTPVNRLTLLFAKWMTIASIGAITGIITMVVVALEIMFFTENLKAAVSFGENMYWILGAAIFISIVYAMFIAALLMITSLMGKTIKESQSYSTPVMMIAMFPAMLMSGIGVNEMTFQHFFIPIMNIFSILKELSFGVVNFPHLGIVIGSNLLFMVIAFVIGRIMFMKDKWVMN